MRNKYPGICYQCGKKVEVGDGHFQAHKGGWRVHHASCAIKNRLNNELNQEKQNIINSK